MPLAVASAEPLDIPESAFNANGLAVIMVPGGRYGGDWSVNFMGADDAKFGEIFTAAPESSKRKLLSDPGYPDRAIETAFIWLVGQAREHGCGSSASSASTRPTATPSAPTSASPAPSSPARRSSRCRVPYADEMTLDEAMGYVTTETGEPR